MHATFIWYLSVGFCSWPSYCKDNFKSAHFPVAHFKVFLTVFFFPSVLKVHFWKSAAWQCYRGTMNPKGTRRKSFQVEGRLTIFLCFLHIIILSIKLFCCYSTIYFLLNSKNNHWPVEYYDCNKGTDIASCGPSTDLSTEWFLSDFSAISL